MLLDDLQKMSIAINKKQMGAISINLKIDFIHQARTMNL